MQNPKTNNDRPGATPDEWQQWGQLAPGDLLPCVMNPTATAAADSKVAPATWSKTPTRFNKSGHVTGIAKWTQHHATDRQRAVWSKNPDYGICLITREFRAVDVDIENADQAIEIEALIVEHLGALPTRRRANSSKFCALVRCPGELSKVVVRTAGGAVEFLATGQQTVVAGTHSTGARLVMDAPPDSAPTISAQRWHDFIEVVEREHGLETMRTKRALDIAGKRDINEANDAALSFVMQSDYYEGIFGAAVLLKCPWASDHTTPKKDERETVYFPAGVGGIDYPGFRCLHAHCTNRNVNDFFAAIGYGVDESEFKDLTGGDPSDTANAQLAAARAEHPAAFYEQNEQGVIKPPSPGEKAASEHAALAPSLVKDKQGRAEPSSCNITAALRQSRWLGQRFRYCEFKDRTQTRLLKRGSNWVDWNETQAVYATNTLELYGFKNLSVSKVQRTGLVVAKESASDQFTDWALQPTWDNTPRIDAFLHTHFGTADNAYTRAVSRYLWVAIAARALEPGARVQMMPVAVGPQGIGKTTGLAALMPDPGWQFEMDFGTPEDENVRRMQGKGIVILSELRGLRGARADHIKAFISRNSDQYRALYAAEETRARRCVFVGDTNDNTFLTDPSGNRRFLPFHVERQIDEAGIANNRDQLIAEAVRVFADEGLAAAHRDADRLAAGARDEVFERDAWHPAIIEYMNEPPLPGDGTVFEFENLDGDSDPTQPGATATRGALGVTIQDVLTGCFGLTVAQHDQRLKRRVGDVLRAAGFERRKARGTDGRHHKWFSK